MYAFHARLAEASHLQICNVVTPTNALNCDECYKSPLSKLYVPLDPFLAKHSLWQFGQDCSHLSGRHISSNVNHATDFAQLRVKSLEREIHAACECIFTTLQPSLLSLDSHDAQLAT